MTNKPVSERKLNLLETETWNLAMTALDTILAGEVLGLLAVDKNGFFVLPKPGCGRALFHFLQTVDWDAEARIAEEHFE